MWRNCDKKKTCMRNEKSERIICSLHLRRKNETNPWTVCDVKKMYANNTTGGKTHGWTHTNLTVRRRPTTSIPGGVHYYPYTRMTVPVFLKLLRSQGIDSASLCSPAGLYDNFIPTRFLAPTDCSKIPALDSSRQVRSEVPLLTSSSCGGPAGLTSPGSVPASAVQNFRFSLHTKNQSKYNKEGKKCF